MCRILLATLDFPPRLGGVARYYQKICESLPSDKIVVLAPEEVGSENFDKKQKYKIYREPFYTRLPIRPKWLFLFWPIFKIIRKEKIEILHVGQVLPLGTIAWIFKKVTGIKYWVYTHGMDVTVPAKIRRKRWLLRHILAGADKIICNSQFTRSKVLELRVNPDKIIVIRPLILPSKMDTLDKPSRSRATRGKGGERGFWSPSNNQKVLLSVSRLVERKGIQHVIEAMTKILEKVPNAVYLIGGTGPFEGKLKDLARQYHLEDKIFFLGAVSEEEKQRLYQLCDVFVLPTLELPNGDVEGFGIVYLEAAYFGKPSIASIAGGAGEAVLDGQTGLLAEPGNAGDIAEKCVQLLTDSVYAQKLGEQGRKLVTEDWKWEEEVEKLFNYKTSI
ncbi:MAG: glycosyltransferase family 4 protein [Parcubacteria group bacterium]|nr:glycosyltransferase family 4 protein [Parcubacteria group bacterium]